MGLVLVCVVWGATFVTVKEAVADAHPVTFLALRFALAFVALGSLFARDVVRNWRRLARPGAILGFWLWAGYAFQTAGLRYTQASRAGFITGLSVVIVPVLSSVLLKARPSARALAGVALALVGLAFLFLVPTGAAPFRAGPAAASAVAAGTAAAGSVLARLSAVPTALTGDLLVLGGAMAFAFHVTLLGKYSAERTGSYREVGALATLQTGAAALGYLAWMGARSWWASPNGTPVTLAALLTPKLAAAVVITGLLASAGAILVQTAAQRHTPPTHTALIFASEPVFAAFFGWLLLGERFGAWGGLGCLLILAGMVVAEWPARQQRKTRR